MYQTTKMQYIQFDKAGRALASELKHLGVQSVVEDLNSNLEKLSNYMTTHIGKDLPAIVAEFKPRPLKEEHPYCWMVWIARGCEFMQTACKYKQEYSIQASLAVKNAYNQTLGKHHNMVARTAAKASFAFLENTIDTSQVNWDTVLTKTQAILSICERNEIIY